MRHGNKINHLGRKTAHRDAMLANMACSLILHKRINTTLAKAKELRVYVEPILSKSKLDTTHSRRIVFSLLQQKEAMKELFGEVAQKIATRPGGYTRIIKTGFRKGDNAETCFIELVDFDNVKLPVLFDASLTEDGSTETTGDNATETANKKRTRRGAAKSKKQDEGQNDAPTAE